MSKRGARIEKTRQSVRTGGVRRTQASGSGRVCVDARPGTRSAAADSASQRHQQLPRAAPGAGALGKRGCAAGGRLAARGATPPAVRERGPRRLPSRFSPRASASARECQCPSTAAARGGNGRSLAGHETPARMDGERSAPRPRRVISCSSHRPGQGCRSCCAADGLPARLAAWVTCVSAARGAPASSRHPIVRIRLQKLDRK